VLVILKSQNEDTALLGNLASNRCLAAHGVRSDQTVVDVQHLQKDRNGFDLVGLFLDLDLS